MTQYWFQYPGEQTVWGGNTGYTEAQMLGFIAQQSVLPNTLISVNGGAWIAANQVPALQQVFPSPFDNLRREREQRERENQQIINGIERYLKESNIEWLLEELSNAIGRHLSVEINRSVTIRMISITVKDPEWFSKKFTIALTENGTIHVTYGGQSDPHKPSVGESLDYNEWKNDPKKLEGIVAKAYSNPSPVINRSRSLRPPIGPFYPF